MPVNLYVIRGVDTAVNVYPTIRFAILSFVSFHRSQQVLINRNTFIQVCSGDKRVTGAWKRGSKVRGSNLRFGTGIATFPNGKYSGHVAIYVGQDSRGIRVWDQWKGKAVSQRTISFSGKGLVNNGNNYYVIQ